VPGAQLGDVKEASQTYDKAVKQTGGDAPGLYKLMGQLARHSTVPGSGISVENLESSLAAAESLPANKLDELEEAAAGVCLLSCLVPCLIFVMLKSTCSAECYSLASLQRACRQTDSCTKMEVSGAGACL